MKYLRGYLVAGIFAAITAVLMAYGQRFSTLVDMIYPYVTRTLQTMLAQWSGQVDFCLWQLLAGVLGVLVLAAALYNSVELGAQPVQPGPGGLCTVIGSEGQGLSEETVRACSKAVRIPMSDRVESLNAGVAGSVLLWQFRGEC